MEQHLVSVVLLKDGRFLVVRCRKQINGHEAMQLVEALDVDIDDLDLKSPTFIDKGTHWETYYRLGDIPKLT